jgi:hypothetical protein
MILKENYLSSSSSSSSDSRSNDSCSGSRPNNSSYLTALFS